ncbi:MAG: hypothetical protein ACREQ9_08210, partial [Candidatus Binatia bacterium]
LLLRHLARHKLRTGVTVAGVSLGVAAMVGLRLVNDAAARSFARSIERAAGSAVLQVTNGEGMPDLLGATIFSRYPVPAAAFGFGASVLLAVGAGSFPARTAARLEVTRALAHE